MIKSLILFSCFLVSAYSSGELTIIHSPSSIKFKGEEKLDDSILKEVYAAALGLPVLQSSKWSGMYLTDPFNLAEAVVTVAVESTVDLDNGKGHSFPLTVDQNEAELYEELESRVSEQVPDVEKNVVRIDLSQGLEAVENYEFLNTIKTIKVNKDAYNYLKVGLMEDKEFLTQLELLNQIIKQLESYESSSLPSVFWFKFSGYKHVVSLHGDNSTAAKEAKLLLNDAIDRLQNVVKKLYTNNVLLNVISFDTQHNRYARAANIEGKADEFDNLNLASTYSENYPVMFNIILWFSVIMGFSLLAICMVIGDMDPGRDSIIYRMTSTRMKKEN